MNVNLAPRIKSLKVRDDFSLDVTFKDGKKYSVNLRGWIATGGDLLISLSDPDLFAQARIGSYGSSIEWDDGDLAIDATHLMLLSQQQRPITKADLVKWQSAFKLSNNEAADLFRISLSSWNNYKAGRRVPEPTQMLMRAMERDPIVLQAFFRPRITGRPKKTVSG